MFVNNLINRLSIILLVCLDGVIEGKDENSIGKPRLS